jgi:transcriptional regulator with XRE-family HTH domain
MVDAGGYMSTDGKKKLGERIRRARMDANLKQADLAERLGVTQAVISNVETGVSTIDVPDLPRWAQILGKPILYFYLDEDLDLRERALAIVSLFPEDRLELVLQMLQPLALAFQSEAAAAQDTAQGAEE